MKKNLYIAFFLALILGPVAVFYTTLIGGFLIVTITMLAGEFLPGWAYTYFAVAIWVVSIVINIIFSETA